MFPVYTGINRNWALAGTASNGVPCIHRDKPGAEFEYKVIEKVFPVYTGINRNSCYLGRCDNGVPCIHRDKPVNKQSLKI